jgi:DNA primase
MVETPVLCFDGDSAGQRAADRAMLRALPLLKPGHSLAMATLPTGVDPDDLVRTQGAAAFQTLIHGAQPLAARLWRYELAQGAIDTPERRAGLKQRLNARVDGIADALVRREYGKQMQEAFYEAFGWRKSEMRTVGRAIRSAQTDITDSRIAIQDRVQRLLMRSILLGVSRHPGVLYSHREALSRIAMPTGAFDLWRNVLVSASYERCDLEEDLIEAILTDADIGAIDQRDFQQDLGWSFYHKTTEPGSAQADLCEVIGLLVQTQDVAGRLAAVEARFYAATLDDEEYGRLLAERDRLVAEKLGYEQRMAELKANSDGLAAA